MWIVLSSLLACAFIILFLLKPGKPFSLLATFTGIALSSIYFAQKQKLEEIRLQVYPSCTNFFLIKTRIPDVARKLRDRGILVFDLSNQWLSGYIRVSVGTPKENDIFLSAIRGILEARDQGKEETDEL